MIPVELRVYRGMKNIARFLDCSIDTVYRMIREEGLPVVKEGGGNVLVNIEYFDWHVQRGEKNGGGD